MRIYSIPYTKKEPECILKDALIKRIVWKDSTVSYFLLGYDPDRCEDRISTEIKAVKKTEDGSLIFVTRTNRSFIIDKNKFLKTENLNGSSSFCWEAMKLKHFPLIDRIENICYNVQNGDDIYNEYFKNLSHDVGNLKEA